MMEEKENSNNEKIDQKQNETKKVKTREDKKEAYKEKKFFFETVVKGSLERYIKKAKSSNFDFIDTAILKNKTVECIESRVQTYSKRVVKGSILINYFLRYIIQKHQDQNKDLVDLDIPEYIFDQTFIRQLFLGNENCRVKYDAFELFVKDENLENHQFFYDQDYNKRHLGDRNIYSFGAKKFLVNCQNHLIYNFDSFLNKYLYNIAYEKYKNEPFYKDLIFATRSWIHNWNNVKNPDSIEKLHKVVHVMCLEVHKIRNILRCSQSDVIDKKWMKDNLPSLVRLFIFVLEKCEDKNNEIKISNEIKKNNGLKKMTPCIKLFHLLPLHTIKPHFISIDNSVFEGIYKEVFNHVQNTYGPERTQCILPVMKEKWNSSKESTNAFWSTIFNFRKLEGCNHLFSNHIGTDGKAVDFHYKRHVDLKETFMKEVQDKLKKIEEKYKIQEEQNISQKEKAPKKKRKKSKTQEEEKEVICQFLHGKRVLGLDPGRVTIMYLAEELEDGSVRSYKLSRCHYYRKSGILKSRKLTECWIRKNHSYKSGIHLLSQNSIKSFNQEKFLNALNVYNLYWNVFWEERMKIRWRSNNFNLYGGKKRVFQQFFNNLEKDNESKKQTVISYGASRFSSTAKNEMAVPTSRAYKECSSRYATFLTNEFRSTVIKYKKLERMYHIKENIIDKEDKKIKLAFKGDLRGLLWFSNQKTNNFIDRDLNGALNIREFLYYGSFKPSIFTREVKLEKEKNEDKKVINKKENKKIIEKMIEKVKRSKKRKGMWKSPYTIVKKQVQTQG